MSDHLEKELTALYDTLNDLALMIDGEERFRVVAALYAAESLCKKLQCFGFALQFHDAAVHFHDEALASEG